ncbi:hypothetical protein L596_013462 [Steinernema carpocapsae]|uniref:Phospholipid/glycerol acyltransferase domain-containing protein n=1 Tax=Steinernema carpocapsae TaxID=34508 RepID=A0A4U5P0W0_STECR|nr:hypothetical protein L596_013462 [Steinernema carpocapsae]
MNLRPLQGYLFGFLLFITSFLGSIFILFPFVPLAFFAPRRWRFCADRFVGYWLTFPASLCDWVFGVRFHVTGDLMESKKPALIIMNHRTRLDWLFFWAALYKMDPWLLTSEKISLKADLKKIPGAGWAMGCGSYMFLNRNLQADLKVIEQMINYYADSQKTYQILLFPEGTDRGERATRISHEFADNNGLDRYEYVLHPRTAGFNHLVELMRKNNYIDYIYDVTVGYSHSIIANELDLVKTGNFPENVHFDVCKYKISDVIGKDPTEDEAKERGSQWLLDLWKAKEARLKAFYEVEDKNKRRLEPSGERFAWPVETRGLGYMVAFLVWILTSFMWLYFAWASLLVDVYIFAAVVFYTYAFKFHGGVEFLFMEWFYGRRFFFEAAPETSKTR